MRPAVTHKRTLPMLALVTALAASPAIAQLGGDNPDWSEEQVGTPPAFDLKRLLPLEAPRASELRWGIDPASISIGNDGVVRYVIVMQSASGALQAQHEGVRCSRQEGRIYARHTAGNWRTVEGGEWMTLRSAPQMRHTWMLSRQGLCVDNAPPRSVSEILSRLRRPIDHMF